MLEWLKDFALKASDRAILTSILIVFGIVLSATVIPGVFIIDEDNYLATVVGLRHGQLSVPGTEGLAPSKELVYFDPEASRRIVESTPVVSLVPPLYAFIALPFSFLGWWGLVLLNILSFLISIYLVFVYVGEFAQHPVIPWIGASLFGLGGYCIEYAQGMWPQMLSVALCLGALILCTKARRTCSIYTALAAGILAGIAVGVREQNIFFAGCVGVGLVLFGSKRFRITSAFVLGVVMILAVIAFINYQRFGVWHPFPKVMGYANVVTANAGSTSVFEPLRVFWSKVVDYSSYGANTDHIKSGIYQWDAASATILVNGIVRKSWIQSSPWVALALAALIACWFKSREMPGGIAQELRVLAVIVLPTLAMFLAAGFNRTDGLSFNQRYFLELLPLSATALSLYLDRREVRMVSVALGVFAAMAVVTLVLILPGSTTRYLGQRYVPVLLGLGLLLLFYFFKDRRVISIVLGACIGWALFIHLESDLVGSRFRRGINAVRYESLDKIIPDHSALFTYWGNKDAAGPLQLDRDVVILDVWADGGKDAGILEQELLSQGWRVFVLEDDFPHETLERLLANRRVKHYTEGLLTLTEVLQP